MMCSLQPTGLDPCWLGFRFSRFKRYITMHTKKTSFNKDELIACAKGELFGEGNARLPLPNMLMLDRIIAIHNEGGEFGKGYVEAELDITPDRKSTRLNSSHVASSYAVFCLKKKKIT